MIKLKHYDFIVNPDSQSADIFNKISGFNKLSPVKKLLNFHRLAKSLQSELEVFKNLDLTQGNLSELGEFKIPEDIDLTSFGARQESEQLIQSLSKEEYSDVGASLIAKICYEEVYKKPFEEGFLFSVLKSKASNLPLVEAVEFINTIVSKIERSNNKWSQKFSEVEVSDPDYSQAGGHVLNKFNTLGILEYACDKFNTNDEGAWKMSFVLIQSSLWKKQSEDHIREKMTKIKEARFKSQQKN